MTVEWIRSLTWDDVSGMSFDEREQIGRTIFTSITPFPHDFTRGKFDSYDVSVTAGTVTANAEIKFRYIKREKWDAMGYWLEKTKYDALMKAYEETGSIPLFYTFVRDGVGYRWDLRKLNPVWEMEYATETTADGQYGKNKVRKEVCHPFPKDAREIKW